MKLKALSAALALASVPLLGAWFPHGVQVGPARVQVSLTDPAYGGVCDAVAVTRVVTTSGTGNRNVAVTASTFSGGDVGKTIAIPGAGIGGNVYTGTIASVTDAQNIVVGSDISTPLSSSTQELIYGTNNITALTTFKTAFQGSTPVQLNLPGNCGYVQPGGGIGKFPFSGIADLIVAGNGSGTSGLYSFSGGLLLGGQAQYQDNLHSLRIATANAGDSCVTAKTQPAVTVSAVGPSFPHTSVFTASQTGTTMTVTAVASGTIVPGAIIGNALSNPGSVNQVLAYGTNGTTGVGGTGTYAMSVSTTFGSQTVFTAPASFTGSIAANTGVLTVTSVEDGTLAVGQAVFGGGSWNGAGGNTSAITSIKSQLTGTGGAPCPDATCNGGVGTYQLDNRTTGGGSGKYQAQGKIRVTLNSTTGLSTGDTLFLSGLLGQGQLPQRMNGLKWISVVNGTQIDLFQWVFDGAYTSGGTGGGDRTSLTPVGSKVMIAGWVNQAYWAAPYGYPSNPHWFEYKTVTSTNSTTHQICFDSPLVNTYKETWPQYNTGSQFEVDPGGPATIYVLDPTWEASIEFRDLNVFAPNGQTTSNGRTITFRNVKMEGHHCAIPTQNVTHNWINVDASTCNIETDKIVGVWNITGGSIKKINIQSSSMDTINVNGTAVQQWFGSPKTLNMANVTATTTIQVGTLAYGASDESLCVNCTTPDFARNTPVDRANETSHPWSMAGGIITIPNAFSASGCCQYAETQTRILVPGHYVAWQGGGGGGTTAQLGRFFKIVDVTQDVNNTYVHTSEAGGFPSGAWVTNGISVVPHPAPKLTVSFTGGSGASALIFNGCPAQAPMFSCQNYVHTGGATGGSVTGPFSTVWGELDSFSYTTNVPTYSGALTWTVSRFGNWPVLKPDQTQVLYGTSPNGQTIINTKLPTTCSPSSACMRTLTTSGATNTQTGDTLTLPPTGSWFGGGALSGPIFSANTPSDSPQVTVNLRTNQNLPP